MYTSNAERIYYEHNPKVKQRRENYEERQYRLAQMHNKIFRGIDQINDAKSFMKVKTMLDAYAHEEGEQSTSVYNLNKRLKNKLSQLLYMVNNSSSRKRYASPKAGTELYLDLVFRQ